LLGVLSYCIADNTSRTPQNWHFFITTDGKITDEPSTHKSDTEFSRQRNAQRCNLIALPTRATLQRSERLSTLAVAARPTILFVVAYALNTTPHEAFHALTAYMLGFNSTIFQMWVNPDPASATPDQLATIAAAGPIFSVTAGIICLLIYATHLRLRPSGLLFLMLAFVGILCFLGPMAGAPFGGDFHLAFGFLEAPGWIAVLVSIVGWLFIVLFTLAMGRELAGWVPGQFGRTATVLSATMAPALIGTVLILALYWPLPRFLVSSTIAGAFFWIPAMIGAALGTKRPRTERVLAAFTVADAAVTIGAIIMIRTFALGIRLAH
jgi:hypothetical protein